MAWFLGKSRRGLNLRAVGENPATADAAGVNVTRYKYVATTVGGALCGIGGMSVVNAALIVTRNGSIAIGLLALAATLLLSRTFIRFVTEPLSRLAQRLRRVGEGNFRTMMGEDPAELNKFFQSSYLQRDENLDRKSVV